MEEKVEFSTLQKAAEAGFVGHAVADNGYLAVAMDPFGGLCLKLIVMNGEDHKTKRTGRLEMKIRFSGVEISPSEVTEIWWLIQTSRQPPIYLDGHGQRKRQEEANKQPEYRTKTPEGETIYRPFLPDELSHFDLAQYVNSNIGTGCRPNAVLGFDYGPIGYGQPYLAVLKSIYDTRPDPITMWGCRCYTLLWKYPYDHAVSLPTLLCKRECSEKAKEAEEDNRGAVKRVCTTSTASGGPLEPPAEPQSDPVESECERIINRFLADPWRAHQVERDEEFRPEMCAYAKKTLKSLLQYKDLHGVIARLAMTMEDITVCHRAQNTRKYRMRFIKYIHDHKLSSFATCEDWLNDIIDKCQKTLQEAESMLKGCEYCCCVECECKHNGD